MNPSVKTLGKQCKEHNSKAMRKGCQRGGSRRDLPGVTPVAQPLDSTDDSSSVSSGLIKTPSGSGAVQIQVRPHKSLKLDCLGPQQHQHLMEVLLNLREPKEDIF